MGSETSGSVSLPGSSSSSTKAKQKERSSSGSRRRNKRERSDYDQSMKKNDHDHRSSKMARNNSSPGASSQKQPMLMSLSSSPPSSSTGDSASVEKISQSSVMAMIPFSFSGSSFGSVISPQQYLELESQALIYKYIDANVPIPSNLLMPIKNSLKVNDDPFHSAYNRVLQPNPLRSRHALLNFSSNTDPEPRRCRRTDGKKWRCSREVVDPHKYCERHLSRARHRSRKHVECPTNKAAAAADSATGDSKPLGCLAALQQKLTLLQFSTGSSSSGSSSGTSTISTDAANYSCSSARTARAKRISRREERKRFITSRIQQSLVHLSAQNEAGILLYHVENQAMHHGTSIGMEIQPISNTDSPLISSQRSSFNYLEEYGYSSSQGLNLLQDLPDGTGKINFTSNSSGLSPGSSSMGSDDHDHDQVLHATNSPTSFTPALDDDKVIHSVLNDDLKDGELDSMINIGSSTDHNDKEILSVSSDSSTELNNDQEANSKSLGSFHYHGRNDQEVNSKRSSPELNDRQEASNSSIFVPSVLNGHEIYLGDLVYPEFNYQQIQSKNLSSSPAIKDQDIHSSNLLDSSPAPAEIELNIQCFSPFRNLGHIDPFGPSFDDLYMMKWGDDDDIAWPDDDDKVVFGEVKLLDLEQKNPLSISIPVEPHSEKHSSSSSMSSPSSGHSRETSTSPSAVSIWNAFESEGVVLGIDGILNIGEPMQIEMGNLEPYSDWDPSCLGPLGEVFKVTTRATSQEHQNSSSLFPSETTAGLPLNNNSTGKAPNNCKIGRVDASQYDRFGSIPMNFPPN